MLQNCLSWPMCHWTKDRDCQELLSSESHGFTLHVTIGDGAGCWRRASRSAQARLHACPRRMEKTFDPTPAP